MNKYLSEKFKVLSAVSILLVLCIHSTFHQYEIIGMEINYYIQGMISGMIGRCAVPLFYVMSGYLFFLSADSIKSVFDKMRKRVRSLLIPYIISSLFFILFFVVVNSVPGTGKFMNGNITDLFKEDWFTILRTIFYKGDKSPSPLAGQLWFLRDLMILVLFSPIWYYLFKYLKWIWIPVVFLINYLDITIFPVYALFWFSLGGALKYIESPSFKTNENKKAGLFLTTLFLFICLLQLLNPNWYAWIYIKIPIILLGISSMWFLYDSLVSQDFSLKNYKTLNTACSFTFFIYLFHEPTLNVIRKLILFAIGKNSAGYLISYLASPWVFIIMAVPIGLFLKKYIPKIYETAVGGR